MSPYQIPKDSHPWRTWQGSPKKDKGLGLVKDKQTKKRRYLSSPEKEAEREREKQARPVKSLLKDLIANWENIEVYTYAYGRADRYKLTELSEFKVAAWLAGVLKRNYA